MIFSDTLSAGDTCKINESTQQKHPKTPRPHPSSKCLKLVSTDLLGSMTPKAIGENAYMAKYTDHHSRLKAVYYCIEKKSNTLHTLGTLIQDLAIPLGLRVQHLRSDNGGEYTSGSFQEYCKQLDLVSNSGSRTVFRNATGVLYGHDSPFTQRGTSS